MADTTVGKLKRSAHLLYVDASFGGSNPSWFLVGKDVEDLSVELSPQTETTKNILDETSVNDNGYEPSISVDTYFANPKDGTFYEKLKDIALNRKTGEACETQYLEVLVDNTTGTYDAWKEDCIIKPTSYGGAQGGVRIPYTITPNGNREKGYVKLSGRAPTYSTTKPT